MNKKSYEKILYLIFIFFVGCILGGLIEVIYQILTLGAFKIGGFLYGPLRPIYGWGSILLYFIGRKYNKNIFTTFLSSLIICSLFEYISSFVLEIIFNRVWWDYTGYILNINGRICFTMSICWGLLGVVFISYLEPLLKKIYNKANKKIIFIIILFIFIEYIIDSVFSLIKYLMI